MNFRFTVSAINYERNGFLKLVVPMDEAVQKAIPRALRECLSYQWHYANLAAHPSERRIQDRMERAYYWPPLRTWCTGLWSIASNAPETFQSIKPAPLIIVFGGWPTEICRIGHAGITFEDINWQAARIGNDGQVLEVNETLQTSNMTLSHIASLFMDQWLTPFGIQKHLVTDNETQFVSRFVESLGTFLGANHLTTTAHHLQTNEQAERFNNTNNAD